MGELLKNKVAVITGAGRGIGRAIAMEMAAEGAKVVVNDLGGEKDGTGKSIDQAELAAKEIRDNGGEAVSNTDSVASSEGGSNIIKTAVDNFGRVDILVNNAGILRDRMAFKMSDEDWDLVIKVNLYGIFYTTRAALNIMREQKGGSIINTSSVGGGGGAPLGNPGQANYTAAKAGVIGFSRTIAMEYAKYGIRCNILFPTAKTRLGWSPELEAAWKQRKEAGMDDPLTKAMDKLGSGGEEAGPGNNAPLVVFLASDAAKNITGRAFHVFAEEIRLYGDMLPIKTIATTGKWTLGSVSEKISGLVG